MEMVSFSFRVGQRVRIARVHHPVFSYEIGKVMEVTRLAGDFVWARPVDPVVSTNRRGERVERRANWEGLYFADHLESES